MEPKRYNPLLFVFQWSSSLSVLKEEASDDVTRGRGWLQLLQALWMTVLPAHWVVVVAEGPELQLLQCSMVGRVFYL